MDKNCAVRIARRFLRSARIDTDLKNPEALEGFICPKTSMDVLSTMGAHITETGQRAFTWTGPYGSGKSSLMIVLSALLGRNQEARNFATNIFGKELSENLREALPTGPKGWRIVPVIGKRQNPVKVIGDALEMAGLNITHPKEKWDEDKIIDVIVQNSASKNHDGLLIFIDEMGKLLESAIYDGNDIYILQQLAELACRSKGRLLFIGGLHQSFEEYVSRLSREIRNEWAKIQGRFIDLAINTSGEEQIELISRAVISEHKGKKASAQAKWVASAICKNNSEQANQLAILLEESWPLHPVVTCLLGPVSRRRFGQNQRSIFGFLNSAEPDGFQSFILNESHDELYDVCRLWDYLQINLESSILASPDGHRWSLASDSLERCKKNGGEEFHLKLLKTIMVTDLFKERSGLSPSLDLLQVCFPDVSKKTLKTSLCQLEKWSCTVFRKYQNSYTVYAGSDFNIEQAVNSALGKIQDIDFRALKKLANLQPVLAKRHYHKTGTMRWFDVDICFFGKVVGVVKNYTSHNGAMGQFLLVIPDEKTPPSSAVYSNIDMSTENGEFNIIVGFSPHSWIILPLAKELLALDLVRNNRPELASDPVARHEILARIGEVTRQLELELSVAFNSAVWHSKLDGGKPYYHADLNSLASTVADYQYKKCPQIHNELINRQKPSASAASARNILLRRMVTHEGEPLLGIEGYPAERGLFASVLEKTGLYSQKEDGKWRFVEPDILEGGGDGFAHLWEVTSDFIEAHQDRLVNLSELYNEWRKPPLGIKDGLMPILAVAFILSRRDKVAVYRDRVFRSQFNDLDIDYLSKDSTIIQLRWQELSDVAEGLLSGMQKIIRDFNLEHTDTQSEPVEIARGLVSIYDKFPNWTKRTLKLSSEAMHIRNLFKQAHDPNKFLFDDLPEVIGNGNLSSEKDAEAIVIKLRQGLSELSRFYPTMIQNLRDMMLAELQLPDNHSKSLERLRDRAENIRQLTGDFRLDAFIGRVSQFNGSDSSFEAIASLAVNKPPTEWTDANLDEAMIDLAELAQQFLRAETFARVKGRPDKRQTIAVIIGGRDGRPSPFHEEFQVADTDEEEIGKVVEHIETALTPADSTRRNLILAALARIIAKYIEGSQQSSDRKKRSFL